MFELSYYIERREEAMKKVTTEESRQAIATMARKYDNEQAKERTKRNFYMTLEELTRQGIFRKENKEGGGEESEIKITEAQVEESNYNRKNSPPPSSSSPTKGRRQKRLTPKQKRISIKMAEILRHSAAKRKMTLHADGYVPLRELRQTLNRSKGLQNRSAGKTHDMEDIREILKENEKNRYTLIKRDGEDHIRANQGHTMPEVRGDLIMEKIDHPDQCGDCVHGTNLEAWKKIKKEELSRMVRNYIHLAKRREEHGKEVGY